MSFAQRSITVEQAGTYIENDGSLPSDVTEINDSNNLLDAYTGTWSGEYENKKIEITVFKERKSSDWFGLIKDRINFRYKIYDLNENILVNSDDRNLGFARGMYYRSSDNRYMLSLEDACDNSKTILLRPFVPLGTISLTPDKMELIVMPDLLGGLYNDPNQFPNCTSVSNHLPSENSLTLSRI